MNCPFCKADHSDVKDSRTTNQGLSVRRRRQCTNCLAKFTTYEKVELNRIYVLKRSGLREPLELNKIVNSIKIASRKSKISEPEINDLANKVYNDIETSGVSSILSNKIGEMIMLQLAKIDEVTYIRFASVYKEFNSIDDFVEFINEMKRNINRKYENRC
ncbi:MAG: transcriptional regulator NrdR [Rickettsiaceae bacterium]|nr:transcriptional regulator NrdR [Rickettsiaceae bacterium]